MGTFPETERCGLARRIDSGRSIGPHPTRNGGLTLVVRGRCYRRALHEDMLLQCGCVRVTQDDVGKRRVRNHVGGCRIETLVEPEEAISSAQRRKLVADDSLKRWPDGRVGRMRFRESANKKVDLINGAVDGFQLGLQRRIASQSGERPIRREA